MIDLENTYTMIIATNNAELAYIQAWCKMNNVLPPFLGERETFPIALSVNAGGWTDSMDRAFYYVNFRDFIIRTTNPKEPDDE